jgi:hypothetical protein
MQAPSILPCHTVGISKFLCAGLDIDL